MREGCGGIYILLLIFFALVKVILKYVLKTLVLRCTKKRKSGLRLKSKLF